MAFNESDTRAKLIDPAIHSRGWTEDLIRCEETAGAVEVVDGRPRRRAKGSVDYVPRIKANIKAQRAVAERLPLIREAIDKNNEQTVAAVAEDIEETTRDFVLKRLVQELKGHPFAEFVAHLLGCMGYRTRFSPPGPDGGVDILAHKDELGFEPPIVKVQVKSSESSVGRTEVSDLSGTLASANEYGLFVSLGSFSPPARAFAQGKSNLRLIDGVEVVDLVLAHYDQLDSHYKGLIPLKRVYVPEPLEDSTE